jgi:hypothetical protein
VELKQDFQHTEHLNNGKETNFKITSRRF